MGTIKNKYIIYFFNITIFSGLRLTEAYDRWILQSVDQSKFSKYTRH